MNTKFNSKAVLFLAAIIFSAGSLLSETIYVISPAAKLLKQPSMSAAPVGLKLDKGQPLQSLGVEGLFHKVKGPGGAAYIARMFVSPFPPQKNTVSLANLKKNKNVQVTKGASAYSETASARGLDSGSGSSDLEINAQYNEGNVKWVESVKVKDYELNQFIRTGKLNNL